MNDLCSYYSADYFQARRRFQEAASAQGFQLESFPISATGPGGEELAIDAAFRGNPKFPALVVSSGLHGVEGFFGSAVQLAWLDQLRGSDFPAGISVLLLHALNPFGFAWRRRFNEENVDPNRNFLLPGQDFSGSPPLYARLNSVLNPARPPGLLDLFYPHSLGLLLRYGMPAVKQAIAGGQYEFPQGLFFGGKSPTESQELLRKALPRYLGEAPRVIHLDFHTGLGRYATYQILLEASIPQEQAELLERMFGKEQVQRSSSNNLSYEVRGGFGAWCEALFPDKLYAFACAEFGAYSPLKTLAGLRKENQAQHFAARESPELERSRRRLVELFCPASSQWRSAVIQQSLGLIQKAM